MTVKWCLIVAASFLAAGRASAQSDNASWAFCHAREPGGSYAVPATDQSLQIFDVNSFLPLGYGTVGDTLAGTGDGDWYVPDPSNVTTYSSATQKGYQWMDPADYFTCWIHYNSDGSVGASYDLDTGEISGYAQLIYADEIDDGGSDGEEEDGDAGDMYCIFELSYDDWGDVASMNNTGVCSDDVEVLNALIT